MKRTNTPNVPSQEGIVQQETSVHPAAEIYPLMEGEELAALVADIQQNGLLEPIVLLDGKILDGRNRFTACREAGIEPRFVNSEPLADPIQYVISKNERRRHLTPSQCAAAAAKADAYHEQQQKQAHQRKRASQNNDTGRAVRQLIVGQRSGRSDDAVAKMFGTNRESLRQARRVRQEDHQLFEEVKAGKVSLPQAIRHMDARPLVAELPEDERERAAAFLAQPSIPPAYAERMAENLATMPGEERLRIYTLHETGNAQQRALARSETMQLPPESDPLLVKIGGWATSLRRHSEKLSPEVAALLLEAADLIERAITVHQESNRA
jgi:ParB-like chromosome segregation protein Spo0J